jgi:hypothetical protein
MNLILTLYIIQFWALIQSGVFITRVKCTKLCSYTFFPCTGVNRYNGKTEVFEVSIMRRQVRTNLVSYEMSQSGVVCTVGYLRIGPQMRE